MITNMAPPPPQGCNGFSLIEIMVASVILGLAITGVLSMLGMGAALETEDGLRRQARTISANSLEQNANHFANYKTLALGTTTASVPLTTSAGATITASLTTTVTQRNASWKDVEGGADIVFPFKTVSSTVQWTFSGRTESVALEKSIAELE